MTDIRDWSTNPASNNGSPPVGAPEGQTAGSINNCLREMMAYTVQEAQANRVKTLTSVAGTNTITASMTPALTAYVGGMTLIFTPQNTNTSGATINVNGLGAISIKDASGSSIAAGQLVANQPAMLLVTAATTSAVLLNPAPISGTFTATLSGAVSTSGTLSYSRIGKVGSLWATSGRISAAKSSSTFITITGLPTVMNPAGSFAIPCSVVHGNNRVLGQINISGGSMILTVSSPTTTGLGDVSMEANFTAAGNAGISENFFISYTTS